MGEREPDVTNWKWGFTVLLGRKLLHTGPLPGSCGIKPRLLKMVNTRP